MGDVTVKLTGGQMQGVAGSVSVVRGDLGALPSFLLVSVVERIGPVSDGDLIGLVDPAWQKITEALVADPSLRFQMDPRTWEEMIAASYKAAGFDDVILTPRSGDGGRDVIATKSGFARIRIIDQVKALGEGRVVTANDVRSLLGVLSSDLNATKGIVTTTARFAPRIAEDKSIAPFFPYRLDLIDGDQLMTRLQSLRGFKK